MPGIAALLDSDMEDNVDYLDENSIISSASEGPTRNATGTAKKGKKRHRVTMPKPKAKVAKASPVANAKKPSKRSANAKRSAIEAQMEESDLVETESTAHQQEEEHDVTELEPMVKSRGRNVNKSIAKKISKPTTMVDVDDQEQVEVHDSPVVARSSHAQSRNAKPATKVVKATKAPIRKKVSSQPLPETQQSEPMDIDSEVDELEVAPANTAKKPRSSSRRQQEPVARRRAGSASDTERGDPNLRRKLGDITRKFENIEMKYRNLKDVGVGEANSNVEKLRKQCEATTEASNNLVASLKRELALQAPLATESRKLKKDMQNQSGEITQLKAKNSELTTSLASAQTEINNLQAKLAAARAHSTEPISKTISSAGKTSSAPRSVVNGSSEALQLAQMKLDLYGDLTGLLVHSVKRKPDGDAYECIQTGRNGTLHFKLFIDQEDLKNTSFEETEFLYQPLLDVKRDGDMIELMPAYLTEDITFARRNAAKFYQRVVDTLSRKIEEE